MLKDLLGNVDPLRLAEQAATSSTWTTNRPLAAGAEEAG